MTHKPEMQPESNQQSLRRDDPAAALENAAAHNNTEERIPSVSHDQTNHSDENAPRRDNNKAWGGEWNGGQMDPVDWERRQIIQETVQVSEPPSNLLKPGLTTRVKGSVEKAVGKAVGNASLVQRGERLKTGSMSTDSSTID